MDEGDQDPFQNDDEDDDSKEVERCPDLSVNEDGSFNEPSSPILNSLSLNLNPAAFRNNRLRRSGAGTISSNRSLSVVQPLNDTNIPILSPADTFESPPGPPITPVSKLTSSGSDDDLFATVPCTAVSSDQAIPSGLGTLLDGPEVADMSWTSSMATPLTGNVTWSNLNTEERKVLLPSESCNSVEMARALFSPDADETAGCRALNMSSDVERTPLGRGRMCHRRPRTLGTSPLVEIDSYKIQHDNGKSEEKAVKPFNASKFLDSLCSPVRSSKREETERGVPHGSPNGTYCKNDHELSPVLSGSGKLSTKVAIDVETEDVSSTPLDSKSKKLEKNSTIVQSTPNVVGQRRSSAEGNHSSTPHPDVFQTSDLFMHDISVTDLEQVCQAQEKKNTVSSVSTPLKQSDGDGCQKKKRLLFPAPTSLTNEGVYRKSNSEDKKVVAASKTSGATSVDTEKLSVDCIPDDSFMEQLAVMNTSVLSNTTCSKESAQKKSLHNCEFFYAKSSSDAHSNNISLPKDLKSQMKEVLSYANLLESRCKVELDSKPPQPTQNLVSFSEMEKDIGPPTEPSTEHKKQTKCKSEEKSKNLSEEAQKEELSMGFKTARGKTRSMSEEALQKGLNLLKDAMQCDSGLSSNNCEDKDRGDALEFEHAESSRNECKSALQCQTSDISEMQIAQEADEVKMLLQLMSDGEDFQHWHETEPLDRSQLNAREFNRIKGNAGNSTPKSDKLTGNTESSEENIKKTSGFSTARGTKITIADEKLAKAQKLFEDCDSVELIDDVGKTTNLTKAGQTNNQADVCTRSKINSETGKSTCEILNRAQGSINNLPNAGKRKEKDKDECEAAPAHDRKRMKREEKAQALMTEQVLTDKLLSNDSYSMGFVTAGGKTMNVCEAALSKAKALFEDEQLDSNPLASSTDHTERKGFCTASGKPVSISEEAISKARNLFSEDRVEHGNVQDCPDGSHANTFLTASGKSVLVSKDAIENAKRLFDENSSGVPAASNRNKSEVEGGSSSSETGDNVMFIKPSMSATGFATATGKFVSVSNAALKKAEKLFVEDNVEKESDDHKVKPESYPSSAKGFSTASGKLVSVSETAIRKAKMFFDDEPLDMLNSNQSSTVTKSECPPIGSAAHSWTQEQKLNTVVSMQGFQTAGGNSVRISEEALKRAKKLFDETLVGCDEESSIEDKSKVVLSCVEVEDKAKYSRATKPSIGFATAGGKFVPVSDGALKKAQKLFDESNLHQDTETYDSSLQTSVTSMKGFSTASGKHVSISETALKKAKIIFDDDTAEDNLNSNQALTASKSDKFSVKNSLRSCVPTQKPNSLGGLQGFQTAGGSSVKISEEALNKAKKLFDAETYGEESCTEQTQKTNELQAHSTSLPQATSSTSTPAGNQFKLPLRRRLSSKKQTLLSNENSVAADVPISGPTIPNKTSLSQEVSATTAALLDDDEFFNDTESMSAISNVMTSILTSPTMLTDRRHKLEPIVSSKSQDFDKPPESTSTSPILGKKHEKSLPRRRLRKGRLSLTSTPGSRSSSPVLGTPTASSLNCSSADTLPGAFRPRTALPQESDISCSDHTVSRPTSNQGLKEKSAQNSNCTKVTSHSSITPVQTSTINTQNTLRLSVQKRLEYGSSSMHTPPQSSFKAPFKSSHSESKVTELLKTISQKRSRASCGPTLDPPAAKRQKSVEESANLYSAFPCWSPLGVNKGDERTLRPEVAEMRRRAAQEQQALVDCCATEKGPMLLPCKGSLLLGKSSENELRLSWKKLVGDAKPGSYSAEKLEKLGIKKDVLMISASNSSEFHFSAWDFYSGDMCRENVSGIPVGDGALLILNSAGEAGVEEVERAFLASPGVDPSLVPSGWIKNHYRWIVWKLASMECSFPHHFLGRCLTPHVLMQQLKYRYDREIDLSQRPALRRILEHDDSPAKRMVLCVASIMRPKDGNVLGSIELEVTDGWYSIIAAVDSEMQHRIGRGVIKEGTKLVTHGAELLNCTEGCSPLEMRSDVRLRLSSNSTRRTRWYAKLGYQLNPGPIKIPLNSILGSGGTISSVTAHIARVYPTVFMEKRDDRTVVRSQRAEAKEASISERKRQELAEQAYSQAQAEVQKEQSKRKRSTCNLSHNQIARITSGEELCSLLENAPDPMSLQNMLTEEQKCLVAEYHRCQQENLRRDVESKVKQKLNTISTSGRQVTPILKVRLLTFTSRNQCSAILSIWRPSEDMASFFKEGQSITILGAVANGFRCGDLQISANRSTRYNIQNTSEVPSEFLRCSTPISCLLIHGFAPKFGELDVVGLVIRVGPPAKTPANSTHFQVVYLSDSNFNLVGVSFAGGIKDFAVDDLLSPHTCVAASNLQWRGGPVMQAVPCVYASELSTFTSNPRQAHLQLAVRNLRQALPSEIKNFVKSCEEKLDTMLSQGASYPRTPDQTVLSKPGTSSSSVSGSSSSGMNCGRSTPQNMLLIKAQRKLAMESASPALAEHAPLVERRLAKLEMYGEPPPLSPINMSRPMRSLRKDFQAPRRSLNSAPLRESSRNCDSPPMSPDSDSK